MSVFRRLTGRGDPPPPAPVVPSAPPPPTFDAEPAETAYRRLGAIVEQLRASATNLATASASVAAREAQLRNAVEEYDRIAREAIAHGRTIQAESAIASSEAAEAALNALGPQVGEVRDQQEAMEVAAARIEAEAAGLRARLDAAHAAVAAGDRAALAAATADLGLVPALVREAEDQAMRLEARARTLAALHHRA